MTVSAADATLTRLLSYSDRGRFWSEFEKLKTDVYRHQKTGECFNRAWASWLFAHFAHAGEVFE